MVGFPSHQPPPDAPSVPPAPPAPPASPAAAKAVTFTGIAQPEPQETSQVRCTPSNSAIDFTSEQPSPASHLALSIHPNDLYENEHSTGDSASPLGTWAAGIGDYRKNFGDALGILPEAHAPALYRMSMPSKVSRRGQIHETDEATALLPDLQGSTKDTPCVSDRKSSVNQAAPRTPDSANHNGGQSIHRRKTVGEAGLGCPFAAMAASGRMQSLEKRSLLKDGKGQRISARSLPQAYARSVATSVSKGDLSDVFGANKGLDELRLDFLDRDDWTHAVLPALRKAWHVLNCPYIPAH